MGTFEGFHEILCFNTGSGRLINIRSKELVFLDRTLSQLLYLDTARLGQASPSAKRAIVSALEFNQAFGASAYFDDLLLSGSRNVDVARDFDGLSYWWGIKPLSVDIKETFFGTTHGELVFASKTSSLMTLAAKMLFARCANVLVTDLNWYPFNEILLHSPSMDCRVSTVEIKQQIFDRSMCADEVVEKIASAFVDKKCDGIFLPAVCNWGIALPIAEILKSIHDRAEIRFSLLDAAQAINHLDLMWAADTVDFIFGGTHKWLRSYEPMAIGYFAKPSSRSYIQDTIDRELAGNPIADPLLRITQTSAPQKSETVNLCPLFATAGALADVKNGELYVRTDSVRDTVLNAAASTNWECFSPTAEYSSRILLMRNSQLPNALAGTIRKRFNGLGIAVTDYSSGICRISLPNNITELQADLLRDAFSKAA